jgi:stage III sporulation protein AE
MKNKKYFLFMVILWVFCFSFSVNAQTDDRQQNINTQQQTILEQQISDSGVQDIWEDLDVAVKERMEEWGITPNTLFSGNGMQVKSLWQTLLELVTDCVKNPLSAGSAAVSVILFCALADAMTVENNNSMKAVVGYFSVICIGAVLMVPIGYLLSKTASAVAAVGDFMLAFLPVYVGILLSVGRTLTAGGAGSLVFGAAQVISYLSKTVILPFISMFLGMSLCAAPGGLHLDGFTSSLKKGAMWLLGLATTLFTALLSITGIINGAGDSMAQRTTRFFIGNMVPVIGGALCETLSTVQGCFSLLKTGSGMFGIVAVLAFLLPVLIEILLWRGVLMMVTAVSETCEMQEISRLLRSVGDGVGILLSLVICSFVIYTVSLSVMVLAGGGG